MSKKKRLKKKRSDNSDAKKNDSPQRHPARHLAAREVLILGILVAVVFLIYSNTFQSPFIFDDLQNIKENPFLRMTTLSWENIKNAAFESPSSNRPVANISFALNYYFHRDYLPGYHVVNLLIHVAAGIFLYFLISTMLSTPALRAKYEPYRWIPFFTAVIWLVHPIQTQSVTYIVQRMNSLSAMFYILSLLLYARARLVEGQRKKWLLFGGCVLAGLLAAGSKEIAATLPFFIFLYEWYFHRDLSFSWLKRNILPVVGVLVVVAMITALFLGVDPLERILNSYGNRDFTLMQRVFTEFRVVFFYLSLLVFPHPSRLNLDHDFLISKSLTDPITTVLALAMLAGLTAVAVYSAKRQRLLSFCILWFLGNLVIESSVIGLEIIFEHRNYLPSVLVILLAVTLIFRHVRLKGMAAGILCAVVLMLCIWTYERNQVWRSDITLWSDCVKKSPQKARPLTNLGVILSDNGNYEAAIAHYTRALQIKPDFAEAHNNMGSALVEQGKLKKAMSHFNRALQTRPNYAEAHNNLGAAFYKQGRLKKAIHHYSEALGIRPFYAEAHNNLGAALDEQGMLKEAIDHYSTALRIKPDYPDAHNNLGVALAIQGKHETATRHFLEALRFKPDFAEAHCNLGNAMANQGKLREAVAYYNEALRINPGDSGIRRNLERLQQRMGRSD
jgi:tetratricopeptide (TPR) repeat protein